MRTGKEGYALKTRVITALIGLALMTAVLLLPPIVLYIVIALIAVIALLETLSVCQLRQNVPLLVMASLFAGVTPFFGLIGGAFYFLIAASVFLFALIVMQICCHQTVKIADTATTCFLSLIVALGISSVAYCRTLPQDGLFYFLLTIFIAWGSDTGAYFVGTFFGKHKLCPHISAKKTVEGFVGGWVASIGFSLLLAFVYAQCVDTTMLYGRVALVAFVLAPISVLGDLFASVIKRQHNAKDYGNIMPGHGGLMDRFDSLLFVSPMLFAGVHIFTLTM